MSELVTRPDVASGERLRLQTLSLAGFRNYAEPRTFGFPCDCSLIVGPNGRGKTNLLEAIYLLCRLRGFREETAGKLRTWDIESAVVEGVFSRFDRRVLIQPGGLRLDQDGDPVSDRRRWVRSAPIFGYRPDDDMFFHAEPERRRRYLDWLSAMLFPDYIATAARYRRALQQRNAALRRRLPDIERQPWDEQLAADGHHIQQIRQATVSFLAPVYRGLWAAIDRPPARMVYRANISGSCEDYAAALSDALPRDLERGWTSVGVHRDDLVLYREGRPVRESASQGYRKLTVILLSLACAVSLPSALFYIDDFEGELDDDNEHRLVDLLLSDRTQHLQLFLTAVRRPATLERQAAGTNRVGWIEL